jgi:hypothetical protein
MRRNGLVPNPPQVNVCLDCWDWSNKGQYPRVVVSRDDDPASVDFRFLAGLDTVLLYSPFITRAERRDALIRNLVRSSPSRLVVIDIDSKNAPFIVVSVQVGLERREYA